MIAAVLPAISHGYLVAIPITASGLCRSVASGGIMAEDIGSLIDTSNVIFLQCSLRISKCYAPLAGVRTSKSDSCLYPC